LKLDLGLSDSSTYCLFNKQTLEITYILKDGLKNNLDGGIAFWPKFIYNDSILIDYKDAFSLLNIIRKKYPIDIKEKNSKPLNQFEMMARNLTETSNPVLIIFK